MRRKFLKIASTSLLGFLLYPCKFVIANNLVGFEYKLANTPKSYNIINPDLTEEQKKIMFEEATERPGTS